MRRLLAILFLFGLALSPAAMAVEEPRFHSEKTYSDFEIRDYPPCIVAETTVAADFDKAGSAAFEILAGYIFGKNHAKASIAMTAPVRQEGQKIAMTAPVIQAGSGGSYRVQFIMPASWTLETLPVPNDPRVHIRALDGARYAVRGYKGSWSQSLYDENLKALEAGLRREGLTAQGGPIWARYDPPFMPWFLKKNEIMIPLAKP